MRTVPGEARYTVTALLVAARTPSGYKQCYKGAPLPADTDPIQVAMLLREGQIRPNGSVEAAAATAHPVMRED